MNKWRSKYMKLCSNINRAAQCGVVIFMQTPDGEWIVTSANARDVTITIRSGPDTPISDLINEPYSPCKSQWDYRTCFCKRPIDGLRGVTPTVKDLKQSGRPKQ